MTDIAKILKDAPKNLKLYSLVHGEVKLNGIYSAQEYYPIEIITDKQDNSYDSFTKDGKIFYDLTDAECMLYPSKEHKSWDGWQDVLFQKGDVITVNGDEILLFNSTDYAFTNKLQSKVITKSIYRYATPEEHEQFFKELNNNGYTWNADTKQMEKSLQNTPKYKVGDYIIRNSGNLDTIAKVNEIVAHIGNVTHYRLFHFDSSCTGNYSLKYVESDFRLATEQELINAGIKEKPFTIDDFKPFDKVLVQDIRSHWTCDFYIRYDNTHKLYACITSTWDKCIPYNDETKHLLGTTDDCPEKYKTW